jgi:hypothetical protein
LLKKPEMAQRLGRNAREKVMKEQRLDIFANYMEDIYEGALHDALGKRRGGIGGES